MKTEVLIALIFDKYFQRESDRMGLIRTLLSVGVVAAFDSCTLLDDPNYPANAELMTFSYYRDNLTSQNRDVTLTDFVYKTLLFYLNQTGKYSLEESKNIARKITSFGCWCQQRSSFPASQEPGMARTVWV